MAMPQMSGLDVLKKLKESDTISHDKIVLLYNSSWILSLLSGVYLYGGTGLLSVIPRLIGVVASEVGHVICG
jgi:hypothetical protein